MNEQMERLIRELADRLGTTGEHLWGVLVKQAMIVGWVNLIGMALMVSVTVWGLRLVHRKTAPRRTPYQVVEDFPEWDDGKDVIAWTVWTGWLCITVIMVLTSLSDSIGALINPEYWALNRLLR